MSEPTNGLPTQAARPSRLSIENLIRSFEDDVRGLPRLIVSPAVVLPFVLVAISAAVLVIAVLSMPAGASSEPTTRVTPLGLLASILALLFLGIPSPPALGTILIASILARRSSYIAGGIAGLLATVGTLSVLFVLSPDDSAEWIPLFGSVLVTSIELGLLIGAVVGLVKIVLNAARDRSMLHRPGRGRDT